jgi:hydrogenase nickel incorporation protein HypA/HybF
MPRREREATLHELSVMSQVAESIADLAREREALQVESVLLQVGELTFLEFEQLEFAWEISQRSIGPPLEGAELTLERLGARGSCDSCGYIGPLKVVEFPDSHFTAPVLDCPRCGGVIGVTEGRDLIIRDVRLRVPEDAEAPGSGGARS